MGKGHETPITERFVKPSFAPSDNPRTPRKGRNPGNHEGFGLFFSPMEPRKTVCATRDALLQEWRKPRLAGLSGTNDVLRHSRSGLPPLLQRWGLLCRNFPTRGCDIPRQTNAIMMFTIGTHGLAPAGIFPGRGLIGISPGLRSLSIARSSSAFPTRCFFACEAVLAHRAKALTAP